VSIQGKYESLMQKPYLNHAFLNSVSGDRGMLVKVPNADVLSSAFVQVAKIHMGAKGNFESDLNLKIYDRKMLSEYRELKNLKCEFIRYKKENHKSDIATLGKEKADSILNEMLGGFDKELKKYYAVTTSIKYYEVLTNIDLALHISADDETLDTIFKHINDIKSIGRSEDFIDVEDARIIELTNALDKNIVCRNTAYIPPHLVADGNIICSDDSEIENCTVYYLNERYTIEKNKRIFNKVRVAYISDFKAVKESKDIYFDDKYIVAFLH